MEIPNNVLRLRKYMEFRKYSQNSIENYCSSLNKFLSFFDGKYTEPIKIPSSAIIEYLSRYKEPNSLSGALSSIKMFYEKCLNQVCKFDKIERPKKSKKLPIVLSQDEVERMFKVCENLKHKVILAILYSCGLRVSELINLKWKDIDRSRMIINIVQAKGNKDRQVMLSPELIPLLEKYYHQYHSKIYVLNGQNDSFQYSDRSVCEVMKQLAKKAGIRKRVYTHLIRHCSFTHMVEQGTDINLIQRLAGHSNVKTTAIYMHISDSLISKIRSPLSSIKM